MLAIFVIWPTLLVGSLSLGLWWTGRFTQPLPIAPFVAILYSLCIALLFATLIAFASGAVILIIGGVLFTLIWSIPALVTLDMAMGIYYALIFGTMSALVLYIYAVIDSASVNLAPRRQTFRQIGGFMIGLLVSTLTFYIVLTTTTQLLASRQVNEIQDNFIGVFFAVIPVTLIGFATFWRTGKWQHVLRVGLLSGWAIVWLTGDFGRPLGNTPPGSEFMYRLSLIPVVVYCVLYILPFVLVEKIAGGWAGAIAGALGSLALYAFMQGRVVYYALWPNLLTGLLFTLLGLTMTWWRPLIFYPFEAALSVLLLRADEEFPETKTPWLQWHPAFWDELQPWPLYGLDDHIIRIYERNPVQGQAAIDQLSTSRQRWAAQAAQIELDAQQLTRCTNVEAMAAVLSQLSTGNLTGPASALLRTFHTFSRDAAVALTQNSNYNQQLVLTTIEAELNSLLRELTRSDDLYALRFHPIAIHWRDLIADRIALLEKESEARQEIPNPYIVGVPLTKHQGIFVGRGDISRRIETLLQDQNHPPLLLYGQRRMGKTSLLYNLRWMLPTRIVPLVVDLQGPVALAADHASFLYNMSKAIYASAQQHGLNLDPLTYEILARDPFTIFDDWLDEIEQAFVRQGRSTILLALDEFEALEVALIEGRLKEEAVLGMLRHVIQHKTRFKLMLAGSHTMDDFARWSSYLINAQMLHLGYLKEEEARQLIEQPVKGFTLRYEASASQRVLAITRGHPYLVQLLCSEIVALKNEQEPAFRRWVTWHDVELAIPEMLVRGRQFFADIELHRVKHDELAMLRWLAQQGEGVTLTRSAMTEQFSDKNQLTQTLSVLIQCELLEEINNGYRFQVEAIRRWFHHR
ncbi:MAG: hypothetical protein U0350_43395 [Caldilineaceae bacterium]